MPNDPRGRTMEILSESAPVREWEQMARLGCLEESGNLTGHGPSRIRAEPGQSRSLRSDPTALEELTVSEPLTCRRFGVRGVS